MDVANDDEDTHINTSTEDVPPLPTGQTDINPDEYYENRLGDLALFIPVSIDPNGRMVTEVSIAEPCR